MLYLDTGAGWPWALHGRLTSALAFRANRDIFASPAKAGALLPTGSKGHRLAITSNSIFARVLKAGTGPLLIDIELWHTIIFSNSFLSLKNHVS